MRWNSMGAFVATLLITGSSLAGSGEDKAAADALFRAGRTLVKQGKFSEACPKLEASQKLDPATGTLLALGDCYESNGQTASAWTAFNDARAMARKANDPKRADEAERRAGLLEPKLSKIIIEVPQDTRGSGVEVRRNGKLVEPAMFGLEVAIDPGKQTIDATAPGQQVWTTEVLVEPKAATTTIRIPSLVDMKPAVTEYVPPPAPPKLPPTRTTPVQIAKSEDPPAGPMSTERKVSILLGSIGLTGLGVGTAFGFMAISANSDARDLCAQSAANPEIWLCPSQDSLARFNSADTYANVSNVGFGLGGAAMIAGILGLAFSPKYKETAAVHWRFEPNVTPTSTSLSITGVF